MDQILIAEFVKLGCKTKTNALNTYQVYMELCEVKKFFDVLYHYSEKLGLMYLTAKSTKHADKSIFIPISSADNISFNKMDEFLQISEDETKSIFIVLVAPDSTCVYYLLSEGLRPVSEINNRELFDKRQQHDKELEKRKDDIKNAAFMKVPLSSLPH